jgi:hypothetical protein
MVTWDKLGLKTERWSIISVDAILWIWATLPSLRDGGRVNVPGDLTDSE